MKVEFYKHSLQEEDVEAVVETLKGIMLAQGPRVENVEEWFRTNFHVVGAVAVNSCTSALFLALRALGVQLGDEVITSPMTFVATANAIKMCGGKPVFIEIDPLTGLIDLSAVEAAINSHTVGILPVHLYGQMVDMKALMNIASKHSLFVLEDAAHCLEGERDGVKPGQVSDGACFSFYATKNITCGDGGMLVTRLPEVARSVQQCRLHGINTSAAERHAQTERFIHWDMVDFGYKMNMTDIDAALLLPQLMRVDTLWEKRKWIAGIYQRELELRGIQVPSVTEGVKHARHLFPVLVDQRDSVAASMKKDGVGVTVNYRPVHLSGWYKSTYGYKDGMLPIAECFGSKTLSLPFYPRLTTDELWYVIDTLTAENVQWNR